MNNSTNYWQRANDKGKEKKKENPRVYLDVQIGRRTGGRVVFELFLDATPTMAENFRLLCTGERGRSPFSKKDLTYAASKITTIERGIGFTAGDFVHNTGKTLGECAFGNPDGFRSEGFGVRKHANAGILSMYVDEDKRRCHSKFHVTFKKARILDRKHIVFGYVVDGMDVVRAIEKVPVETNETPRVPVVITGSGELKPEEIQALAEKQKKAKMYQLNMANVGADLLMNPKLNANAAFAAKEGEEPAEDEIAFDPSSAAGPRMQSPDPDGDEDSDEEEDPEVEKMRKKLAEESESDDDQDGAFGQRKIQKVVPQLGAKSSDGSYLNQSGEKLLADELAKGFEEEGEDGGDGAPQIGIKIKKVAGGRGAAASSSSTGGSRHAGASSSSAVVPGAQPVENRKDRLANLRLKMNQGRQQNVTAVLEEKNKHDKGIITYYKYQQENKDKADKKQLQDELAELVEEGKLNPDALTARRRAAAPKGKEYLQEPMEISMAKEMKKRKKMTADENIAYNVFNQDSLYRAQEKRNNEIVFDHHSYQQQKKELGEDVFYNDRAQYLVSGFKETPANKQKFLDAMAKAEEKKNAFSRRRTHVDDADFQHINERNRVYNQKMDRFYGDHTLEIRQNLERGTAL
ncbi:unnamed protein product [Amoebophrya sp. A120]|nr:unnamed protein product [Amoebophrya sp. A120]|eukprot:GSA120T00004005001.1